MEERGRLEKLGYPTDAKRCYQQASQLYEEALELRKKHLGVAHRDTLASLDHLGSFYLGDPFHPEWIYQPEKTLQLWTEAWRLRSASLGEKHPETLRSLETLLISYSTRNDSIDRPKACPSWKRPIATGRKP